MQSYPAIKEYISDFVGMDDPTIVIQFLLQEIRCRDNRIDTLEEQNEVSEEVNKKLTKQLLEVK